MKISLIRRIPAAAGAALLLTCGSGAAAYALVADSSDSPSDTGNTLPIDDNHQRVSDPVRPSPTSTGTRDDRRGRTAVPAATHEATHDATHDATDDATDDATEHAAPEPGDDHGTDAPEVGDDHSGRDSSGSGRSGGSDDSGHPDDH